MKPDKTRAIVAIFFSIAVLAFTCVTGAQESTAPSTRANNQPSKSTASKTKIPPRVASAMDGLVVIEKDGKFAGLGFVLGGDGRTVTSLTNIGDGNQLTIRYVNASAVAARVGHTDRKWDLALLIPQGGVWSQGLLASTTDPVSSADQVYTYSWQAKSIRFSQAAIKNKMSVNGGDGITLPDVYELRQPVSPTSLGAPIVNSNGFVLAVLARGCKPDAKRRCAPVVFGAPVSALRQFLRSASTKAVMQSPWLGVQAVKVAQNTTGVRVDKVHKNSPADGSTSNQPNSTASTGLFSNDVIIAMEGEPITSVEKLAMLVRAQVIGKTVSLIVIRKGKYVVVPITLAPAPPTANVLAEKKSPN